MFRPILGPLGFGSIMAALISHQAISDRLLLGGNDPVHALRSSSGKRRKTGRKYPHSSARQNARYARQVAAGQLSMAGVER